MATVVAFDLACSSWRADSELAAVNAAAGQRVRASPLFLDAVEQAIRAARLTDGDVDPTVGGALIAYGFYGDGEPSLNRPRLSLVNVPGYDAIEIDRGAGAIKLPRGVVLDLGATAKALAADRAAAAARDAAG